MTYDTLAAARHVAASADMMTVRWIAANFRSAQCRPGILDGGRLKDTRIFATGDLDELENRRNVAEARPWMHVALVTAPARRASARVGGVYKLVEIERAGALTGS